MPGGVIALSVKQAVRPHRRQHLIVAVVGSRACAGLRVRIFDQIANGVVAELVGRGIRIRIGGRFLPIGRGNVLEGGTDGAAGCAADGAIPITIRSARRASWPMRQAL